MECVIFVKMPFSSIHIHLCNAFCLLSIQFRYASEVNSMKVLSYRGREIGGSLSLPRCKSGIKKLPIRRNGD